MSGKERTIVEFEDARLIFTNFSGVETDKNSAGSRNFCVVIDDKDDADRLARDGWNVKVLPPKEDGDRPVYFLRIIVRYGNRPPRIMYRNRRGKNKLLTEETVGLLDGMNIESADVVVSPSYKSGHPVGYVQAMRVTIRESRLEAKWAEEEGPDED